MIALRFGSPVFFLLLVPLTLPLAQYKVTLGGVPLYVPEVWILAAGLRFFLERGRISARTQTKTFYGIFFGGSMLCVGAAISLGCNPMTLTGLGMLKSWFIFPFIYVWLWSRVGLSEDRQRLLFCLYSGMFFVALGSMWYLVTGETTYDGRLRSWYASPNYLALYLSPAVLMGAYFFVRATQETPITGRLRYSGAKIFFVVSGTLVAVILYATRSYGAWAGVLGAAGMFFSLNAWLGKPFWKMMTSGLVALFVVAGGLFLLERGDDKWSSLITFDGRSSLASRVMIWKAAGSIGSDHPLSGIGVGRFQEEYLAYQKHFPPYLEWAVPQPHNLLLAFWLQTGLVGLVGSLWLATVWAKHQWLTYRRTSLVPEKNFRALFLSLLVLLVVTGLVDTPFFKNDLVFLWWTVFIAGAGFPSRTKNDRPYGDR